jgi:hypothetical protein
LRLLAYRVEAKRQSNLALERQTATILCQADGHHSALHNGKGSRSDELIDKRKILRKKGSERPILIPSLRLLAYRVEAQRQSNLALKRQTTTILCQADGHHSALHNGKGSRSD